MDALRCRAWELLAGAGTAVLCHHAGAHQGPRGPPLLPHAQQESCWALLRGRARDACSPGVQHQPQGTKSPGGRRASLRVPPSQANGERTSCRTGCPQLHSHPRPGGLRQQERVGQGPAPSATAWTRHSRTTQGPTEPGFSEAGQATVLSAAAGGTVPVLRPALPSRTSLPPQCLRDRPRQSPEESPAEN